MTQTIFPLIGSLCRYIYAKDGVRSLKTAENYRSENFIFLHEFTGFSKNQFHRQLIYHWLDIDTAVVLRLWRKQCMQKLVEFWWKNIRKILLSTSWITISDENMRGQSLYNNNQEFIQIWWWSCVATINRVMHPNIYRLRPETYLDYEIRSGS